MSKVIFFKSEKVTLLCVLIGVALFETFDIFRDLSEGSGIPHVLGEILITLGAFAGVIWLGVQLFKLRKKSQANAAALYDAARVLVESQQETQRWKEEATTYLKGLSQSIDRQFEQWELTAAEREVGLLILKGLSLKEIAEIRDVSEKTVRSQSLSIYSKSGLSGRAELSAFFMEDFLAPAEATGALARLEQ